MLGWTAFDQAFFLGRGVGLESLRLLPVAFGSALLFAALIGLMARGAKTVLLLFLFCVAGALLPRYLDDTLPLTRVWLPRFVLLLFVAWSATALLARRQPRLGTLPVAFAFGILAAIAKTVYRQGWLPDTWIYGGATLLWLAMRFAPKPIALATTVIAVSGIASTVTLKGLGREDTKRVDLAAISTANPAQPNLVMVVMDTVRADHLSCYGANRMTTPVLDSLAAEHATRFTQARSTSPFTLPSHASLLTGRMPGQHHAAQPGDSALPIREELPTLADILRKTGYQTSAIVANHVYLNEIYGFDRGFEHFDRRPGGGVGEYVALAQVLGAPMRPGHLYYRDAKEITDDAVQWLEEERRAEHPFFLFLNYLDPHTPYLPPARFDSLFEDRTPVDPLHPMPEVWALLYDRELHYVDEQLGRLFDALRENDAFENTVVLVTSDHGEGLGEHGIPWHNWHLYDGLIRVPLIVKPVGLRRAELDKTPITSAGVFGLALRELGLEAPPSSATVLSEWYPHLPVTAEQKRWAARAGIDPEADRVAWLEDNRKLIVSSSGAVLAFDLSLDPNEEQPLTLSEEEATAARQRAEAWWNANPLPQDASPELDAEHIRNMRALGY